MVFSSGGNFPYTASGQSTRSLYGPGGLIDTSRPFEVIASVSAVGALSVDFEQRDDDSRRLVRMFNRSSASNPGAGSCGGDCGIRDPPLAAPLGLPDASSAISAGAWEGGLVLAVSLWGNFDLARWLDHECPSSQRGSVQSAQVLFSDFSIHNFPPPPGPQTPPIPPSPPAPPRVPPSPPAPPVQPPHLPPTPPTAPPPYSLSGRWADSDAASTTYTIAQDGTAVSVLRPLAWWSPARGTLNLASLTLTFAGLGAAWTASLSDDGATIMWVNGNVWHKLPEPSPPPAPPQTPPPQTPPPRSPPPVPKLPPQPLSPPPVPSTPPPRWPPTLPLRQPSARPPTLPAPALLQPPLLPLPPLAPPPLAPARGSAAPRIMLGASMLVVGGAMLTAAAVGYRRDRRAHPRAWKGLESTTAEVEAQLELPSGAINQAPTQPEIRVSDHAGKSPGIGSQDATGLRE